MGGAALGDIERIIMDHFRRLISSSDPSEENIQLVLKRVWCKVTDGMNQELTKPYTQAEVVRVLSQIFPCKSPRPDGFIWSCFVSEGTLFFFIYIW